jgi:hypothetical protein
LATVLIKGAGSLCLTDLFEASINEKAKSGQKRIRGADHQIDVVVVGPRLALGIIVGCGPRTGGWNRFPSGRTGAERKGIGNRNEQHEQDKPQLDSAKHSSFLSFSLS